MAGAAGKGGATTATTPTGPAVAAPVAGGTTLTPGVTPAINPGTAGAGYGVNPMQNSAKGFSDAFKMLQSTIGNNTLGGNLGSINPSLMQGASYNASLQNAPEQIRSLMGTYQNPYETEVVQRTTRNMADSMRQAQMGNADAAIAAGAFGGGRHGVVEGVTNAEGIRNIGDMTAQLRQQGFDTAAGLASQDVSNRLGVRSMNQNAQNQAQQYNASNRMNTQQFNANAQMQAQQQNIANQMQQRQNYFSNQMGLADRLGNLSQASYGVGQSINNDQMNAGGMSQQLNQSILDQALSGYGQLTGQPANLLQLRLASLGMNPLNNATTTNSQTQTNPGWGAMFGNLLGAAGNMFRFNPITFGGG